MKTLACVELIKTASNEEIENNRGCMSGYMSSKNDRRQR